MSAFKANLCQHTEFTAVLYYRPQVLDRILVSNNPVNFVDPTGQFLVSGAVLVGYVYGPAIVAAGTAAAYRLGPYLPAIGEFVEGFVMPGPPPSSPAGYAGSATRYAIDEAIDSVLPASLCDICREVF